MKKMTIAPIVSVEGFGTDVNGFLYKLQAGGVYKPVRPITARWGATPKVYFRVVTKGRTIEFFQETLKIMQGNAIGRIVNERRN